MMLRWVAMLFASIFLALTPAGADDVVRIVDTPGRPAALRTRPASLPWIDLAHRKDLRRVERDLTVVVPGAFFIHERRRVVLSKMTIDGTDVPALRVVPEVLAHPEDGDLRPLLPGVAFPDATLGAESFLWSTDSSIYLVAWSETSGRYNTLAATSPDKVDWTPLFEMPAWLSGSHYRRLRLEDGRALVAFLDLHPSSPTRGDYVAWIGAEEDFFARRAGDYTCRLAAAADMPDPAAVIVVPTRGGWELRVPHEPVLGARMTERTVMPFTIEQLDALVPTRGYDLPLIDLDGDADRFVVVDREPGQYLGHVSTTLLGDGRTILAVYPKGHGRGPIVYKRSTDGGRTWSERLPTPDNWATSLEVPTIHRVRDPQGDRERLILWSGLYPARRAVSEDDGATWSELEIVGDWGGIVVMGFVERLRDGRSLAMFHDDGRFFTKTPQRAAQPVFTLYQTFSDDGGLTWSQPTAVWSGADIHLCEPGCVRSPDGSTLAVLLRENSRTRNSSVIFSTDEAKTWSAPRELPASLTGDRHTAKYGPDGRLFICFRDTAHESPTQGDWCGWVGTWDDLRNGTPGQYRIRFKDNKHRWDTTYPGVECLPDGTFVVTTYGHWDEDEEPYILSARFTLAELDRRR